MLKAVFAVFVLIGLIYSPIVTIFSINALFGLVIPVTIKTWLAIVWLSMFVSVLLSIAVAQVPK
jgi:hypothetical protein